MRIFGYEIIIKKSTENCQHRFDAADVINMTKDPKCCKCKKQLSSFTDKKFTINQVHNKLLESGYGNQFCLNVVEALSK